MVLTLPWIQLRLHSGSVAVLLPVEQAHALGLGLGLGLGLRVGLRVGAWAWAWAEAFSELPCQLIAALF